MNIPFYSNDETNTHCFQACVQMTLGYFEPKNILTMGEVVQLSGAVDGMSTWPSRTLVELDNRGYDVTMIEGFDGRDFVERGAEYLRDAFGGDTAEWQIKNSNIEKERSDYRELYDRGISIQKRIPTQDDIRRYLDEGYVVITQINSKRLVNQQGYVGHSVVVLGIGGENVLLHNPGLPPVPNQRVDSETFAAAWAYPNDGSKVLIAIKRRNDSG